MSPIQMNLAELKELHKNCNVCTEVHELIDKYKELEENGIYKIAFELLVERIQEAFNVYPEKLENDILLKAEELYKKSNR